MTTTSTVLARARSLASVALLAGLAGGWALACSSDRPEVATDPGPGPNPVSTDPTDASARDADADADAGADAEATGCPPPDAGSGPAPSPGLCSPTAVWGAPSVLPFSMADDQLASMTPDEGTFAAFRTSGPTSSLYVVDREAPGGEGDPFGEPQFIDPDAPLYGSRAALSPDGRVLVVLGGDRRSFVVFDRPSRTDPFVASEDASPARAAFAKLNEAGAALGPDGAYDDPVFGADGGTFLYSVTPAAHTLRVSTKGADGVWSEGVALEDCELASSGDGSSRRPSALSADGRTLFYFDEVRAKARAAFRGSAPGPFIDFVDLGARSAASPSADCTRLYSSQRMGASSEIVSESRMP